MAAVTGWAPARRPRIPGALAAAARGTATHAKTATQRLSGSFLTIAGLGCFDVGAFTANTIAGWFVTGASVLLLDWKLEGSSRGEHS
ncbi:MULTISPECIES: hypothetical protein [unclassified Kitasatospora]|uniref:hypothetical protein n=1 Tax=unclassified Kitasatospora TaxID=2633591 RepID=UPI002476DFC5|nr:hypothetical protein [Kitasatospora sp. GAS204B]